VAIALQEQLPNSCAGQQSKIVQCNLGRLRINISTATTIQQADYSSSSLQRIINGQVLCDSEGIGPRVSSKHTPSQLPNSFRGGAPATIATEEHDAQWTHPESAQTENECHLSTRINLGKSDSQMQQRENRTTILSNLGALTSSLHKISTTGFVPCGQLLEPGRKAGVPFALPFPEACWLPG
jgi:hypothetical protein